MERFQAIFTKVSELAAQQKINSVVFDKRSLTIFHQPSMEWYYLEWKDKMLQLHGLKNHVKFLPKDLLFRQSVKQAREKILRDHPVHCIKEMKLLYFENMKEALQHHFS